MIEMMCSASSATMQYKVEVFLLLSSLTLSMFLLCVCLLFEPCEIVTRLELLTIALADHCAG